MKRILKSIIEKNTKSAALLLMLLLSADFIFIALYIIHCRNFNILDSALYDIGEDLSYSEFYQYMKYLWIILLFTYILISTKCLKYISWILLFLYFLIDDALEIHEKIGGYIAGKMHFIPQFNLRLQDYGELIVSAVAAMILFPLLGIAYWRGSENFRKISIDMALFIAALVFFGVGMDMAHQAIKLGWVVDQGMEILEDGGEMVVVSLTLWYVFLLASRKGDSDLYLNDILLKSVQKKKK